MELNDFSSKQQKAILIKDGNVLVSAGAGSGKTAVLIQRLYEILSSNDAQIDELLVLTFTNFAAKELKVRLKEKLNGQADTLNMAGLVEASDITTFDSFALKLVKKYSYILDLNPNLYVFDQGLYNIKRRQFIEEILQAKYQSNDQALLAFVSNYLKTNDEDLFALIIDFDQKANLEINLQEYVKYYIKNNYSDEAFARNLSDYTAMIKQKLDEIFELINLIDNDEARIPFEEWALELSGLSTYEDYLKVIPTLKLKQISRKIDKEDYLDDLDLIAEIKDKITKKLGMYFLVGTVSEHQIAFAREKAVAEFVVSLYQELQGKMDHFKQTHNIYTFSDIARFAYQIVSSADANQSIRNSYKYILVDEYQDTSDIQEAFVQAIAKDNVYMVGDIKQSIYGFRNANPKIFAGKYELYDKAQNGTLINLVDNYRSRSEIVDGVNQMLNEIMTNEFGGAEYQKAHQIGFGNKTYDNYVVEAQTYGLDVFYYENELHMDNDQQEAYLVGIDIINKIKAGYQVYDGKLKANRNARFSDFTILCRKRKFLGQYLQIFNDLQIPLSTSDNVDAKTNNVVQVLMSALQIFLAIKTGVFGDEFRLAFASFARGFAVKMDDQLLYDYIANKSLRYRDSELFATFKGLVAKYSDAPASIVTEAIINSFSLHKKIITLGDVANNRQTLVTIIKLIASLEALDMDFAAIVAHFNFYDENDEKLEVTLADNVEDAVTLMTIHGSKGLEFPIVYFVGFSSQFNFSALTHTFKASNNHGLILPMGKVNKAHSINYHLEYHENLQQLISEEIRLLYVGLTRPREKMIILAPVKDKAISRNKLSAKSLLNLLETSKYYHLCKREVKLGTIIKAPKNSKISSEKFLFQPFPSTLVKNIKNHASVLPDLTSRPEQELLTYGQTLHRFLEVVDLESKETSFIKNSDDRSKIDKVLTLEIFNGVTRANAYREYRFYEQATNLEGIIDLFIVRQTHIDLIDFKLFNIASDKYEKQLDYYANYLVKTFNLPVKIYLLSILKSQYTYIKTVN